MAPLSRPSMLQESQKSCVTDGDDKQSSGRLLDGVYPKRRRVAWNKA